jgi:hypothetical protein
MAYINVINTPVVNNQEETPDLDVSEIQTTQSSTTQNPIQKELNEGTNISNVSDEKLFDPNDKELKKGSVVKYNDNYYLFWNENAAGKAQLINIDGTKFSGTPNMDKMTDIIGSFKSVEYNSTEYIVTDKGNIYSGATGNRVYEGTDNSSMTQKQRIIDAAKMKIKENEAFLSEINNNISDIKSNFESYKQMYPEKFTEMGLDSVEDIDKLSFSEKKSLIAKLCRPS